MLKKLLIIAFLYCSMSGSFASEYKTVSIIADINLKGIGIGVGYQFFNRVQTQLITGISSNFIEKKWDDIVIQSKTQYQVLNGKHVSIPIGLVIGGRAVNNYADFYGVFFWGVYSGLDFRFNKQNAISLNCGYKYGKKKYVISHTSESGTASYIEMYKEQPLILSLSYSLAIH